MGGDCEEVKGGDRRHSSVSIAPLSRPQTRNPLLNNTLHISIASLHLRKQPSDASILRQRAVVIY